MCSLIIEKKISLRKFSNNNDENNHYNHSKNTTIETQKEQNFLFTFYK